jgi:hypothetical protein
MTSKQLARDHYADYGYKEGRTVEVPSWDKLWLCGDTPRSSCKCKGNIHYGQLQAPDNNSTLATFDEMREWETWAKRSEGYEWTTCKHDEFGLTEEPNKGTQKQCWCEPTPKYIPSHCGDDGSDCLCNGLVFYMKRMGEKPNAKDFYSAMRTGYTVNNVNATNGNKIKCTKSNFEMVNPLPGEDKQCFCDQDQRMMNAAVVQQVKEYWRTQLEALQIREA